MKDVIEFTGNYSGFSSTSEHYVTYKNITYRNLESAFQAQKSEDWRGYDFTNMTGKFAKIAGMNLELREDWDLVKDKIMEEIVVAKVMQNTEVMQLLMSTGNCNIISDDEIGNILMKIRTKL